MPTQPQPDRDHPGDRHEHRDVPAFFVRPASKEIDFARVVRRADLCRRAARVATLATGVTGLLLIAFLLTYSRVLLVLTLLAAGTLAASFAMRVRLATAPIPYLRT